LQKLDEDSKRYGTHINTNKTKTKYATSRKHLAQQHSRMFSRSFKFRKPGINTYLGQ